MHLMGIFDGTNNSGILFDHSQGHAWKKVGALDANYMPLSLKGHNVGCLRPFQIIFSFGDQQSMVFKDGNLLGPWWIVSKELCNKHKT